MTRYFIFFICVLLSSLINAQSKKNLEIINSNYTIYDSSVLPDARRLVDSVIFKHNNTLMYCDSAWHYFKENRFKAFGNIHINKGDTLHLYGNRLNYDGKKGKAILSGNIVLIDKEMRLETSQLEYDLNNNIASYYSGAKIQNNDNELFSKIGNYFANLNQLNFKKDVELINVDYKINCDTLRFNTISEIAFFLGPTTIVSDSNLIYCENGWYNTLTNEFRYSENAYLKNKDQQLSGDSLYYNRDLGYGLALINIEIIDTINNFILNGQKAELFEFKDSSIVTIDPLFTVVMDNDSLFLHSDTICAFTEKNEKIVKSSTGVKFFNEEISGKCQSLFYFNNDSTICLYDSPILWSNDYQMTADTIVIQMKNKKIDKLFLFDNSFIVSNQYPDFYNQIKGKDIVGLFKDNKMNNIQVFGNGQVSYTLEDNENKLTGINTVNCSFMNIDVKKSKIDRISFQQKPESVIYPTEKLPEKWKKLKGFIWRVNEKINSKKDIWKK